MGRTEDKLDGNVDKLEACDNAALKSFLHALLHSRNKLNRNNTPLDRVDEFKMVVAADILFDFCGRINRLHGSHGDFDVTVLTASSGLVDMLVLGLRFTLNGLAIGYLRLADVGLNTKLALHAVNHNLELELAHTHDDCF